ncbi:hypothetical protein F5Y19DRAFT_486471 [Xylariaceae sp. FL1651]|nr:hypothetical protein F5Y19DRAFT_486471 [Xylariaceae sp. FL1651]
MDFVYVAGKPEGPQEMMVAAAGWKWVRINTIHPTRHNRAINLANIDRIPLHSHHGENTHVIVTGDLCIENIDGEKRNFSEISTARGAAKELIIKPNIKYRATSKEGCSFVEGHRCLSPRTAERFIDRGTLKAVELEGGNCSLPDEEVFKTLLRGVKFNPAGRARPNRYKGEKPILIFPHSESHISLALQRELANWFEKEWQQPKCQTSIDSIIYPLIPLFGLLGIIFYIFIMKLMVTRV